MQNLTAEEVNQLTNEGECIFIADRLWKT